jgi:hypothetical protein
MVVAPFYVVGFPRRLAAFRPVTVRPSSGGLNVFAEVVAAAENQRFHVPRGFVTAADFRQVYCFGVVVLQGFANLLALREMAFRVVVYGNQKGLHFLFVSFACHGVSSLFFVIPSFLDCLHYIPYKLESQ